MWISMKECISLVKDFCREEDGLGIVELVLIIIILIGLVILFKGKVEELIGDLFNKAGDRTDSEL